MCVCDIASPTDLLIASFSDWRRLKAAVAWKVKGHVAGTELQEEAGESFRG